MNDGDGKHWERKDRKELKERLYGQPPRGVKEKAAIYVTQLLSRMKTSPDWPLTLLHFADQLREAMK
jgi:hypothetical protein